MPEAVRRYWGQIDLKPILTAIISTAIISGFGFLWSKVMKVDVLEVRMSRIEDSQEIILQRLPPAAPSAEPVQPAGYKRPAKR